MRLLSLVLAAAFVTPAFATDAITAELTYRSYRRWTVNLPAETWFKVNDGIRIRHAGGEKFAAALEGERLRFDTDGDGQLDRTIKALVDKDTKVSTSRVILNGKTADGQPLRYAVRLRKDQAGWEWAPGGAMVGTINAGGAAIPVRLIDQNGNGRFDDVGKDAMIVGSGDEATFLSETMLLGRELRRVTVSPEGSTLKSGPFEGPTATLDLTTSFDSKAVLLAAIIRSADGKNSFNVASTKGGVQVPAGDYHLIAGAVGLGRQRATVREGRMAPVTLKAGQTRTIDWGGPVKSEFRFVRLGNQVTFSPDQIWYYGAAGEEYSNWQPCGKSPEFKVKDKDTGAVLEVAILPGSC